MLTLTTRVIEGNSYEDRKLQGLTTIYNPICFGRSHLHLNQVIVQGLRDDFLTIFLCALHTATKLKLNKTVKANDVI